jgi:hypothetical protein
MCECHFGVPMTGGVRKAASAGPGIPHDADHVIPLRESMPGVGSRSAFSGKPGEWLFGTAT